MKPAGWLLFFGAPIASFWTIRLLLPFVGQAPRDTRLLLAASAMWLFVVLAWGYIWEWDNHFSTEQFVGLCALPPIGLCLGQVLWKWTRPN
jgi:hypothetical protein